MPAHSATTAPRGRHRSPHPIHRRPRILTLLVAVLAAFATTGAVVTTASGASGSSSAAPIRAAFYYPWYPETEHWASHYTPTLGHYDSSDPAVLAAHVAAARYAGLDAFIASWWGQGTPTDKRLPLLLSAAQQGGLSIAPYYEPEGQTPAPSTTRLDSDLAHLYAEAQSSPAWLRVGGKPVLFVYNSQSTGCSVTSRWTTANAGRFYIDLKVFPGYQNCADQPDSWHQYGPASDYDQQGSYSASVSPGFFKFDETTPRLGRDLTRFKTDLQRQVASGARVAADHHLQRVGRGHRGRVRDRLGLAVGARRLPGRDALRLRRAEHSRTRRRARHRRRPPRHRSRRHRPPRAAAAWPPTRLSTPRSPPATTAPRPRSVSMPARNARGTSAST